MTQVESKSVAETERVAADFAAKLKGGGEAVIVGLQGELGSGKTTFVKGVAKALGIGQTVTSPTFVIEKIYKLEGQPFSHLIHIDAYRLEGGKEFSALGFHETAADPGNLILVEWPERVADVLPEYTKTVRFTFVDDEARLIEFL